MSTRDQEIEEMKGYKYMVLVSKGNESQADYVIVMNDFHEKFDQEFIRQTGFIPQLELEYLVRCAHDRARILAVIKGSAIEFNRQKFYYGMVKTVPEFCRMVVNSVCYQHMGNDYWEEKVHEIKGRLKGYFGSEYTNTNEF